MNTTEHKWPTTIVGIGDATTYKRMAGTCRANRKAIRVIVTSDCIRIGNRAVIGLIDGYGNFALILRAKLIGDAIVKGLGDAGIICQRRFQGRIIGNPIGN